MADSDQPDFFAEETSPSPAAAGESRVAQHRPLAARMRPRRLAEVVGQDHILKAGSLLPRLVAQNRFGSLVDGIVTSDPFLKRKRELARN